MNLDEHGTSIVDDVKDKSHVVISSETGILIDLNNRT